jgi:hypothetical protein
MIDWTHVVAFAIGGIFMWCVLTYLHRKAMNELTAIAKICLHDIGQHAVNSLLKLTENIKENLKK